MELMHLFALVFLHDLLIETFFYMELINKKQVWQRSEDIFLASTTYGQKTGPKAKLNIEKKFFENFLNINFTHKIVAAAQCKQICPEWLNWPGRLAGTSEGARRISK